MIHLDHQVIALNHFYEGIEVDEIYTSFASFQEEVNIKTKNIFSELIQIVEKNINSANLKEKIEKRGIELAYPTQT